jgi:hypothetical protein
MWEIKDGDLPRYRCHIGHAYTQETITAGVDGRLKRALATVLRALNERVAVVGQEYLFRISSATANGASSLRVRSRSRLNTGKEGCRDIARGRPFARLWSRAGARRDAIGDQMVKARRRD